MPNTTVLTPQVWETPEITQINRLPIHTTFHPYDLVSAARGRDPVRSPWVRSLNGTWQLKVVANPFLVTERDVFGPIPKTRAAAGRALKLKATRQPSGTPPTQRRRSRDAKPRTSLRGFAPIAVPANWNLHGFGKPPQYTNIAMPFEDRPPHVPADDNPTGIYRTQFRVPRVWKGRRVVVHFGGVESCFYLYCNGAFVGLSKDSRLPAEFDLTPHLVSGANQLAVVCLQYSDASYIEDQDHWWMAGIFRDVFLYTTEAVFLQDIAVTAGLDESGRRGELAVAVQLGTAAEPTGPYEVRVDLFDGARRLWERPRRAAVSPSYRRDYYAARVEATVPRVKAWSTELPHLYTAVVSLHDETGRLVQASAVRTGFRTTAVVDGQFLLNGQPVYIKGACHHDHDPDCGKAVRREMMERDVRLMKQFNLNALRTSHYPSDPYLYDLCDEYGILVIDEANLENHSNYRTLCHDPRWAQAYFERITRMVQRDRNHPSIFAWSLCNESGYGPNHDRAADWIRQHDATRLVHHEGAVKPRWDQGGPNQYGAGGERGNDFINPMYESVPGLIEWARSTGRERGPGARPFILCEYCSTTGNSGGCLKEYWDVFYAHRRLQGGFTWQWVDHGLRQRDRQGREYWAYGGDFGEAIHDHNFMCNGAVDADRNPHPVLYEYGKLVQPVRVEATDAAAGRFEITNLDCFRNTDWLKGSWRLEVNGRSRQKGDLALRLKPQETKAARLPLAVPDLAPGEEAVVTFSFRAARAQPWCARGHQVAWEQFVVGSLPVEAPAWARSAPATGAAKRSGRRRGRGRSTSRRTGAVELRGRGAVLTARTAEVTATFDAARGTLEKLSIGGRPTVVAGPEFNLWRTPIDNDGIRARADHRQSPARPLGRWLAAGYDHLTCEVVLAEVAEEDGAVTALSLQKVRPAAVTGELMHLQRLRLEPDGRLLCEHTFELPEGWPDPPRLGVLLRVAGACDQLTWYGRGPHESYPDRKAGAALGLYKGSVAEQHHPYAVPQENGSKEDVRHFSLRDAAGRGLVVGPLGAETLRFSAHRYTPQELEGARHTNEVPVGRDVVVLIDAAHRGLGSGACGPDTLPHYIVGPGTYTLAYQIQAR